MRVGTVLMAMAIALWVMMPGTVAAEKETKGSLETGRKLFSEAGLGGSTNGRTCVGCHPDGKGLERAGKKEILPGLINRCIAGPLQGKKLDEKSVEMESLVLFIKSLAKEGKGGK